MGFIALAFFIARRVRVMQSTDSAPASQGEPNMNWDQIQGNWKYVSGKVRQKWGKLTDDDLTTIAGRREQFAGILQERYGYAREQVEKSLDDFALELKE